ncbi:hypothetical protein AOLI_G00252120 [Acnodon oligacanthus]
MGGRGQGGARQYDERTGGDASLWPVCPAGKPLTHLLLPRAALGLLECRAGEPVVTGHPGRDGARCQGPS